MDQNASMAREHAEPQYRPGPSGEGAHGTMLFPQADAERLRSQWSDIQADFVDSPRQAVERADALVSDAMKRLSDLFTSERAALDAQWDRGDAVTTEDLRVALQRYRAFFDRLLSISSS